MTSAISKPAVVAWHRRYRRSHVACSLVCVNPLPEVSRWRSWSMLPSLDEGFAAARNLVTDVAGDVEEDQLGLEKRGAILNALSSFSKRSRMDEGAGVLFRKIPTGFEGCWTRVILSATSLPIESTIDDLPRSEHHLRSSQAGEPKTIIARPRMTRWSSQGTDLRLKSHLSHGLVTPAMPTVPPSRCVSHCNEPRPDRLSKEVSLLRFCPCAPYNS